MRGTERCSIQSIKPYPIPFHVYDTGLSVASSRSPGRVIPQGLYRCHARLRVSADSSGLQPAMSSMEICSWPQNLEAVAESAVIVPNFLLPLYIL